MKEYLLLFRGGLDFNTASAEQLQQNMQKWKTWMENLAKEGKYIGGHRLIDKGNVIASNRQVSDGPYAEGKEIVAGFVAIKANNMEEAIEIAKQGPIFDNGGLTEVREIAPAM